MQEFIIRRLRRAPIIKPLWDKYERMMAARDAAVVERDRAVAEPDAAVAQRTRSWATNTSGWCSATTRPTH